MLNPLALKTMSDRGIQSETLVRFGVESVERSDGNEWISFPYFVGNEIVNHKFRTIGGPKKFFQEADARKVFWNLNSLMDTTLASEPLIICEGEIDALSALEADYSRVLSVPDGAPAQEIGSKETSKYTFLDEVLPLIRECSEIILATDNDGPGLNLLNDLALRIGKARCKWVQYPLKRGTTERCKDLNEVLVMYGARGIRQCIERAKYIQTDGVYAMDDLAPLPEPIAYQIGFPGLDNHWKIRRGDFIVVTGIPSHGKSSFLNDVASRMAVSHGWRTAFASFEQTPQTDHRRNLRAWHDGQYRNGGADKWINDQFRFIVPKDTDMPDLEWLKERVEIAAIQHECEMIVIDPWNEVEHNRFADETLTEYTGRAIREFKRLAKQLNVALIVAAHPAKMRREDGKYVAPALYDISDSAHWANKADVGICIFRPDINVNETQIAVLKVRYQHVVGKPGTIRTHFLLDAKRYEWADQ